MMNYVLDLGLLWFIRKMEGKHRIENPIGIVTIHAFGSQEWSIGIV
jgi:hypothetical protein